MTHLISAWSWDTYIFKFVMGHKGAKKKYNNMFPETQNLIMNSDYLFSKDCVLSKDKRRMRAKEKAKIGKKEWRGKDGGRDEWRGKGWRGKV